MLNMWTDGKSSTNFYIYFMKVSQYILYSKIYGSLWITRNTKSMQINLMGCLLVRKKLLSKLYHGIYASNNNSVHQFSLQMW